MDVQPQASSAAGGRPKLPPVNEIVIKDMSPEDPRSNFCPSYSSPALDSQASRAMSDVDSKSSSRPSPRNRSASLGVGEEQGGSSFSSPFILKPRNHVGSSSYSMGFFSNSGGIRGRKRPAHSISTGGGSLDHGRGADAESSSENGCPLSAFGGFHAPSQSESSTSTLIDSPTRTADSKNPHSELDILGMQGLSLQSPVRQASSFDSRSPLSTFLGGGGSQPSRPRASSFNLYSGTCSPAGSATTRGGGGESSIFRTSGSARSSPRHVPLTVISGKRPGMSPSKNHRPPLHVGASTLLYSLDASSKDSDDEDMFGSTKMPAPFSCDESSMSNSEASPRHPVAQGFCFESPEKKSVPSPRTPLPRITLTPRTPGSTGSRKHSLPIFPSPDDVEGSPRPAPPSEDVRDHLLYGYTGMNQKAMLHSPMRPDVAIAEFGSTLDQRACTAPWGALPPMPVSEETVPPARSQLNTWHPLSSSSLALSVDDKEGGGQHLRAADSLLSLRSGASTDAVRHLPLPHGAHRLASSRDKANRSYAVDGKPVAKARSILAPSRSGGALMAMFDAEAAADETGSLTESDDEDEFFLFCPAKSSEYSSLPRGEQSQPDASRKSKCRKRFSSWAESVGVGMPPSTTSLTSGLASNTSLFGMDILLEDGPRSSTPRPTTPFSGQQTVRRSSGSLNRLRRRESDDALQGLFRGRSEVSLGSVGLSLDAVDDAGRELVTPPVTSVQNRASSPPPLAPRMGNGGQVYYPPLQAESSPPISGTPWA